MSITIGIMIPIPEHDIDEIEGEFALGDNESAIIDGLVSAGYFSDRAEVIKHMIDRSLREHVAMCNRILKRPLPNESGDGYRVGESHPSQETNPDAP